MKLLQSLSLTMSLSGSLFVVLMIPAPPEAKLTPVIGNALPLDTRERYGGDVANPTFSAAKQFKNTNLLDFSEGFNLKSIDNKWSNLYIMLIKLEWLK